MPEDANSASLRSATSPHAATPPHANVCLPTRTTGELRKACPAQRSGERRVPAATQRSVRQHLSTLREGRGSRCWLGQKGRSNSTVGWFLPICRQWGFDPSIPYGRVSLLGVILEHRAKNKPWALLGCPPNKTKDKQRTNRGAAGEEE